MKKILFGCGVLALALLAVDTVFVGCGSNSTSGPVTVTQAASTCTGTYGFAYSGPSNSANLNKILSGGVSINSSGPVTAFNMGLYVLDTSTQGPIRGAIYAGTNAGPTTLIAQSAPQTDVIGAWNEIALPTAVLSPGYYWLAIMAQNTSYVGADISNTSGYIFVTNSTVAFGSFPSTMPAGTTSNFTNCFYVNTCP